MLHILRKTTAIAALAALPFSPVAAQSGSGDQGGDGQLQGMQNQGGTQGNAQAVQSGSASGSSDSAQNSSSGQKGDSSGTAQNGSGEQNAGTVQDAPAAAEQQAQENQQLIRQQTPTGQSQADAQSQEAQEATSEAGSEGQGDQTAGDAAGTQEDVLIATVGDTEIRRSDVIVAIGQLPPQLQQQAPEMLIPLALDQLVTRELILQEARDTDLAKDPEVLALAPDNATDTARDNALVQVWLDRQLKDRVTDDKVQAAYDAIKEQFGAQAPALDQLRPQIEGQLRQQAFAEISGDLQTDAEITVYGPDGQPVTQ